jgi:hypothetical protein
MGVGTEHHFAPLIGLGSATIFINIDIYRTKVCNRLCPDDWAVPRRGSDQCGHLSGDHEDGAEMSAGATL